MQTTVTIQYSIGGGNLALITKYLLDFMRAIFQYAILCWVFKIFHIIFERYEHYEIALKLHFALNCYYL